MKVKRMKELQFFNATLVHQKLLTESDQMSAEDKTMAKAAKYDKLMSELKAKLDCPVCLTVPIGGQMLACPRGHLVCSPCRVKMTAEGQEDCPVCREPMGNNKSLLAMVVIENMEHECTNMGCKEKLAYEEVTKHREELCKFRKILCPGLNCQQLLPLSSYEEHAKTCSSIQMPLLNIQRMTLLKMKGMALSLTKVAYEEGENSWRTLIFNLKNETFFLRVSMKNSNLYFEPVMLAERDKCTRFTTTISILDSKAETSFIGQFNPRPIGPTDAEESILKIHKSSLANVFFKEGDGFKFMIEFKVSEKRAFED